MRDISPQQVSNLEEPGLRPYLQRKIRSFHPAGELDCIAACLYAGLSSPPTLEFEIRLLLGYCLHYSFLLLEATHLSCVLCPHIWGSSCSVLSHLEPSHAIHRDTNAIMRPEILDLGQLLYRHDCSRRYLPASCALFITECAHNCIRYRERWSVRQIRSLARTCRVTWP